MIGIVETRCFASPGPTAYQTTATINYSTSHTFGFSLLPFDLVPYSGSLLIASANLCMSSSFVSHAHISRTSCVLSFHT